MREDIARVRDEIRARMQAGECMSWVDVLALANETIDPPLSCQWAHTILKQWRKRGLIHVARYSRRRTGGMPRPHYAWGPGKDAEKPRAFTNTEKSRRYRKVRRAKATVISPLAILLGPQAVAPGQVTTISRRGNASNDSEQSAA